MDVVLNPKLLARLHRAFPGSRGNAAIMACLKRYLYLCEMPSTSDDDVEVLVLVKFWRSEYVEDESE